jgi:hypothetical protein
MALSSRNAPLAWNGKGREKMGLRIDQGLKTGIEFKALQEVPSRLAAAARQPGRKPSS